MKTCCLIDVKENLFELISMMLKIPMKIKCQYLFSLSFLNHYSTIPKNSSYSPMTIRVFPKVDHSANVARIVLVEHTIGSVVDLNFC